VVTPTAGSVVLVPFPFSDLSNSKLRPAVVLAFVDRDDWILCQVTSKSYSDSRAVEIVDSSFSSGSLHLVSYARPGKLFTAHASLFRHEVGVLRQSALDGIVSSVVSLLRN
jgi:mRNA interferase MazF